MSDAFEIGVTLALSDGVSDGIARARREMLAFEHVLTAGGVSVAQLRKAAMEAVHVSQGRPDRPHAEPGRLEAGVAKTPVGDAAVSVTQAATHDVLDERRDERSRDGQSGGAIGTVGTQASPQPDIVQPVPAVHAAPRPPAWQPDIGARTVDRQAAPAEASAPQAAPACVQSGGVSASVPSSSVRQAAAAGVSTWVQSDAAPCAPRATAPDEVHAPPGDQVIQAAPGDQGAIRHLMPMSASFPATEMFRASAPQQASAPAPPAYEDGGEALFNMGEGVPSRVAPAAPSVSEIVGQGSASDKSAAAADAPQRPEEGDVFLDGMLVGRWMSRLLAREAGRASAGPTGFDARRGRLLPGATVGN